MGNLRGGGPKGGAGNDDPIRALAARHVFDSSHRPTRGDGPLMAFATRDVKGPGSPSRSPMG